MNLVACKVLATEKRRRWSCWSDLQEELLSEIWKRLTNHVDLLRLRSVCKSWRKSLPHPFLFRKPLPVTVPQPPYLSPFCPVPSNRHHPVAVSRHDEIVRLNLTGSFVVTERTLYLVQKKKNGRCKGTCGVGVVVRVRRWTPKLVAIEEVLPVRFVVSNLFTTATAPAFSKSINLLEFSVKPIAKFSRMLIVHHAASASAALESTRSSSSYFDTFRWRPGHDRVVDKVVLVSNTDHVSPTPVMNGNNNVVVAALGVNGKLALLTLLGHDYTPDPVGWRNVIYNEEGFRLDDVVNFEGKLCGIDSKGGAFLVDCNSFKLSRLSPPPPNCNLQDVEFATRKKSLLEASGVLYLLVPCLNETHGELRRPHIKVYKLSRAQTQEWVQVESLEDQAFVVGIDFALAIPAATSIFSDDGREGNCIFLEIRSFPRYDRYTNTSLEPLFKELLPGHYGIYHLLGGGGITLTSGSDCPELLDCKVPCCLANRSV